MRYETISDLPEAITDALPEGAQEIYLEAYKRNWESYDEKAESGDMSRHAVAHRNAWSAIKEEYVHDEEKGMWYRKGEEPEEDRGILDDLKDVVTEATGEGEGTQE
jgi:cation transport regulator